jgi:hypothetical protein
MWIRFRVVASLDREAPARPSNVEEGFGEPSEAFFAEQQQPGVMQHGWNA